MQAETKETKFYLKSIPSEVIKETEFYLKSIPSEVIKETEFYLKSIPSEVIKNELLPHFDSASQFNFFYTNKKNYSAGKPLVSLAKAIPGLIPTLSRYSAMPWIMGKRIAYREHVIALKYDPSVQKYIKKQLYKYKLNDTYQLCYSYLCDDFKLLSQDQFVRLKSARANLNEQFTGQKDNILDENIKLLSEFSEFIENKDQKRSLSSLSSEDKNKICAFFYRAISHSNCAIFNFIYHTYPIETYCAGKPDAIMNAVSSEDEFKIQFFVRESRLQELLAQKDNCGRNLCFWIAHRDTNPKLSKRLLTWISENRPGLLLLKNNEGQSLLDVATQKNKPFIKDLLTKAAAVEQPSSSCRIL